MLNVFSLIMEDWTCNLLQRNLLLNMQFIYYALNCTVLKPPQYMGNSDGNQRKYTFIIVKL